MLKTYWKNRERRHQIKLRMKYEVLVICVESFTNELFFFWMAYYISVQIGRLN